jgi:hypothetical protein
VGEKESEHIYKWVVPHFQHESRSFILADVNAHLLPCAIYCLPSHAPLWGFGLVWRISASMATNVENGQLIMIRMQHVKREDLSKQLVRKMVPPNVQWVALWM